MMKVLSLIGYCNQFSWASNLLLDLKKKVKLRDERKFCIDESRTEELEGWSGLRDLSLPKDWVIDLF